MTEVADEERTDPECPRAIAAAQPAPVRSWWSRYRAVVVDGAIVTACATAAVRGAVEWDTVVPIVAAIVLSHAKPEGTSLETAVTPLLRLLPKLLRRGRA